MKVAINAQEYRLSCAVRENPAERAAFCTLAEETFRLDFESWYQKGWWTERYRPYTLFDGEKAVANVSVNTLDFRLDGKRKRFVQLGTVMTAPDYRGRGLSRFLLEKVLGERQDACDLVYLYANDSVVDFYPKFGFQKAEETAWEQELPETDRKVFSFEKLDPESPEGLDCLLSHYAGSNPFSACTMEDNPGLLLFYCGSFLRDSLWYIREADAVLVAEREENSLLCWDIFGGASASLPELLSALAGPGCKTARLGFLPRQDVGARAAGIRREEDETLFVLGRDAGIFADRGLLLPLLSHT